jgi:hypothetical protein
MQIDGGLRVAGWIPVSIRERQDCRPGTRQLSALGAVPFHAFAIDGVHLFALLAA